MELSDSMELAADSRLRRWRVLRGAGGMYEEARSTYEALGDIIGERMEPDSIVSMEVRDSIVLSRGCD